MALLYPHYHDISAAMNHGEIFMQPQQLDVNMSWDLTVRIAWK